MFTEPIKAAAYDDLLTVVELWFKDGPDQTSDVNWPSGKFLIRGGVHWPDTYNPETQSVEGFAVVLGYNLGTDRLFVFDETPFACVAPIIDPQTRKVLFHGIASWMGKVWGRYLADGYYTNQTDDVCRRWEREVHSNPGIQPPPRFIPCMPWRDVENAEALIWDWITRRRMDLWADGDLAKVVKTYQRGQKPGLPAALCALAAALSGLMPNVPGAKEVASAPDARIRRIGNVLIKNHPRDWHDPE